MTKLYITEYSPFARMARIVVREKGLGSRVEEILAQTRVAGSPYYAINPSGRVPYIVRSDGIGLEGSQLVCDYLDNLDQPPTFRKPGWSDDQEFRRLEELARSLMDGVSVWIRELARPRSGRFEPIIVHERERAMRMLRTWDAEIDHELMQDTFNIVQLTLACTLYLEQWNPSFEWRADHPKLAAWLAPFGERPSFRSTVPPAPLPDI